MIATKKIQPVLEEKNMRARTGKFTGFRILSFQILHWHVFLNSSENTS